MSIHGRPGRSYSSAEEVLVPGSAPVTTYEDSAWLSYHRSPASAYGEDATCSPPSSVVSTQSSTVSQLIRELQDQGRDHGPVPTPRMLTPVTTPRAGLVTPRRRQLSDMMVAAGVDVRDDESVASDIVAGMGFVEFFRQSLAAEDKMLRCIEKGVAESASRADSLYSTVQLQVAGLEEDNKALHEKVVELELHNQCLRETVSEMTDKSKAWEQENLRLHEVNSVLEELNDSLHRNMQRDAQDLTAEIDLLRATARAQKQEIELERTRMEQEINQGKREALKSQQQLASMSHIEKRSEDGLMYKRNYDTVYAQAQMLQERVWSLEKDLIESQERVASENALLEAAYHKNEVALITQQLISLQAETEAQKSELVEQLKSARSQLENELVKNKDMAYFKAQCERISGIDMTQLCSTQEFNLVQQLLLTERVNSSLGRFLAIWVLRYRRKRSLLRARAWLASRWVRKRKLNALFSIRHVAQQNKRRRQILYTCRWRKIRSVQLALIRHWMGVVSVAHAFKTATNSFLQRSERSLASYVLEQWQLIVDKQKMADEHMKSAGLRRSFRAATAAMSTLDAQDFQDFLPKMAPGVYGGNQGQPVEKLRDVWEFVISSNQRRRTRSLLGSVLMKWHLMARGAKMLRFACLLITSRRDLRLPAFIAWHRVSHAVKWLKRICHHIMRRLDNSMLKDVFNEWRTSWGVTAKQGRISTSRSARIQQAAQNILPPWMHEHIDRALIAAVPEEERDTRSTAMVSIAVQVERKAGELEMDLWVDKCAGIVNGFVDREARNRAFATWRGYLTKKRMRREACRRAVAKGSCNLLRSSVWLWREELETFDSRISKSMEMWLKRIFGRESCGWAFSQWITACKSEAHLAESRQPESPKHGLRLETHMQLLLSPTHEHARGGASSQSFTGECVPSDVSPHRYCAQVPRVMGTSPPPLPYESPRTEYESEEIIMELVLNMKMEEIADDEQAFKDAVVTDIAQALNGEPSRIKILDLQAGSIIVTVALEKGVCGQELSLMAVGRDLESQSSDTQSRLKQGSYTCNVTSVKMCSQSFCVGINPCEAIRVVTRSGVLEKLHPRRTRHFITEWSLVATRQRDLQRRVILLLRHFKQNDYESQALSFKAWLQHKCHVLSSVMRLQNVHYFAVLRHIFFLWEHLLQTSWQSRKSARISHHRTVKGILRKWSVCTEKRLRVVRIFLKFACRTKRAILVVTFRTWRRWLITERRIRDFECAVQQQYVSRVFEAWGGYVMRFRRGQTVTIAYQKMREGTLVRSLLRTWFCNTHVGVHLRDGFQDQVLAMSTIFLSDLRTNRLNRELTQRKGRRRLIKACQAFAAEMSMSNTQKAERDTFESWRTFCNWRASGREFYLRVENLSDAKLSQKYMIAWARKIQTFKKSADVIHRILRRWNRRMKGQVFSSWNLLARMRSEVYHKIHSFRRRSDRRVKQGLLTAWKTLSDFEELLIQISLVMESKVLQRACYAWHQRLLEMHVRCKKVWRATLVIRRSTLKTVISKWHWQSLTQMTRNKAVSQMLHSVFRGKLWVATLSWRNHTRIIASGKSKVAWMFAQHTGTTKHRSFWTWTQFCRTCRASETILIRAKGRRMAQTAQEALERSTLLEWLYRQQFKALFRVRMQRAAALVQGGRLRNVIRQWHTEVGYKNRLGRILIGQFFRRDRTMLSAFLSLWNELKCIMHVLRHRHESFEQRSQRKLKRWCFWHLKSERSGNPFETALSRMQTRRTDKYVLLKFKRAVWMWWTFAVKSQGLEAANRNHVTRFASRNRMRTYFNNWLEVTYICEVCKKFMQQRTSLNRFRGFHIWKDAIYAYKTRKRNFLNVINIYRHRIVVFIMAGWVHVTKKCKSTRANIRRALRLSLRRVLASHLFTWYDNVKLAIVAAKILRHKLNISWHSCLYGTFEAWARHAQQQRIRRRNIEMSLNIICRKVTRNKLSIWRESTRSAKLSAHIFRTIKNRWLHARSSTTFSRWAAYVSGMGRKYIKNEIAFWIKLVALRVARNDTILFKTLQMWKDQKARLCTFLETTFSTCVFRTAFCAKRSILSAWAEFVSVKKQNQSKCFRIESIRTRNLYSSSFTAWLIAIDEIEDEYNASKWDEWRGPVPEWYAESMVAVLQQRMSATARILRAWTKLIDDCHSIIAEIDFRRKERFVRRVFAHWQHLQEYNSASKMDSLVKEDCVARRSCLHLQRDAKRVWSAYTRKHSALRMGNASVNCTLHQRRKYLLGLCQDCPEPMQKKMTPRMSTHLQRCVKLLHGAEIKALVQIFMAWQHRSRARGHRSRICKTLVDSSQYSRARQAFSNFKSYCSQEVYHTHELRRLQSIMIANWLRRFLHSQLVLWYHATELHESRLHRLSTTANLLLGKTYREQKTRGLMKWVAYRDCRRRLRSSENHVWFKMQMFIKRRFFREWKDVEWLNFFSSILEKWYRMSMGQIMQSMQRRAVESLSKMWDRTSVSILADLQSQPLEHSHETVTDAAAKENRAVQFQDSLLPILPEQPPVKSRYLMAEPSEENRHVAPQVHGDELPHKKSPRKKLKTPPKIEPTPQQIRSKPDKILPDKARVAKSAIGGETSTKDVSKGTPENRPAPRNPRSMAVMARALPAVASLRASSTSRSANASQPKGSATAPRASPSARTK